MIITDVAGPQTCFTKRDLQLKMSVPTGTQSVYIHLEDVYLNHSHKGILAHCLKPQSLAEAKNAQNITVPTHK